MISKIESNAEAKQYIDRLRADAMGNGAPGATSEAAAKLAIKQVSQLISSDSNLRISTSAGNRTNEVGQMVGGTGIPEIDDVGSRSNLKKNLDKLLLYLQLDNDERMAEMAQTRLEGEKGALKTRHDDMKAQIEKNIAAIDKAAKKAKFMKIFGWVMLAVSVVVAVASCGAAIGAAAAAMGAAAATAGVAAAGVGAGAAAAGGAAASVASTVGSQVAVQAAVQIAKAAAREAIKAAIKTCIMNAISVGVSATTQGLEESGKMEEITKSLAEKLRKSGSLSKEKAEMWAQIILGVATIALTMGTGIGGAKAAGTAMKSAATAASAAGKIGARAATTALGTFSASVSRMSSSALGKTIMTTMALGMTGGAMAGQGLSIKANYAAGMTQAETTELQAVLKMIQQMIEETQEELEEILQQEQALITKMFTIINSAMETENEISKNIGTMA